MGLTVPLATVPVKLFAILARLILDKTIPLYEFPCPTTRKLIEATQKDEQRCIVFL